jgi:glycosyltransferase involved in cell wall biosynthesis
MALVSIVIPVHNRETLIERALLSAASQTFRDFEIIVVDDGSTDGTTERVSSCNIAGLTLVRHTENRGAAAARNTGIRASHGDFIAMLDSDDTWEADKLRIQIEAAKKAGSAFQASCTGFYLHDARKLSVNVPELTPGTFKHDVLWGCTISPGSTLLVTRQTLDRVGPQDECLRRLEDWDWLLRFAEHGDMRLVQQPLAHVYVAPLQDDPATGTDTTMQAIARIEAKHSSLIYERSKIAHRKFRSTLFVERAAHMYRLRRPIKAALYIFVSLFYYPKRNAHFFKSLLNSARHHLFA